ncbi:glutamate--tRNA ligase [Candidatus Methylopumilus universalis]|uniref:Glutamate--tRNA ligase n=1 Tax=Candidatus Methylopumilus universalis TaxID=2588536 RepID=A0AAX1F0C3_9PROT|nr:glutamate--tRNA ligase [Candidatus Methylopumilus universalis]QDC41211.1 glutamate--tRNA ligase [Candidatus Methylopumilus universalis]QDC42501.1 glutamate--tRNA ligase [Candidatus Methylopumilus universalis]QDC54887.1 glutamate--tRNA ligase [Candidatus Methylopumilus universalis]QDC56168.1 glutamate--tRNA ligase [Candidatus Methylopumilus universalis]QDC57450.1 glutamate--tRNA ligase [Candidatus Methylopumilus universalis]
MTVVTRFAPSPTGYLHIGGARTALFSWAYAKRHQGKFILRIEDTDIERSTPEAVEAIMDGMTWLHLHFDEGPIYQTKRMAVYKQYIDQLIKEDKAYLCYSSKEELEVLRESQMKAGLKPKYDGKWRPEPGRSLPPTPKNIQPVVRFKNPTSGVVSWHDLVKGEITIANEELDDLVIARGDGTPTYNFCVVIDDWEMKVTHVIRGDDHINNTPRQINLLKALNATIPAYAHLSMILGDDGQKLSKRHGAVSVMQYFDQGYLPEAILNYLARLGWSHGDDEIFSMTDFCQWFDLDHITSSSAQFNTEKLDWLNSHYIKTLPLDRISSAIEPYLKKVVHTPIDQNLLISAIDIHRERANHLTSLAGDIAYIFEVQKPNQQDFEKHINAEALELIKSFQASLNKIDWTKEAIHNVMNEVVTLHAIKFPKLAMPLRVLLTGIAQSPSIDAVMAILGRDETMKRLNLYL